MRSDAATVDEYLASLPEERRRAISTVRDEIVANLPPGYEEAMNWGMITYQVPLATCPDGAGGGLRGADGGGSRFIGIAPAADRVPECSSGPGYRQNRKTVFMGQVARMASPMQ